MKESVVEARHRRLAFVVQNASCRYERVAKADAARAKRSWGRRLLALESSYAGHSLAPICNVIIDIHKVFEVNEKKRLQNHLLMLYKLA